MDTPPVDWCLLKEKPPLLEGHKPYLCDRTDGVLNLFRKCGAPMHTPIETNDRACDYTQRKIAYTMCYNKNYPKYKKYCGPDFTFSHWDFAHVYSFKNAVSEIMRAAELAPAIHKVGWYGNIKTALPDVIEYHTRPLLHKLGKQFPNILDIHHVYHTEHNSANFCSLPDLTKYMYLIDIGGNGWSGRLKFLLFMRRPLFLVDRVYVDYFYEDLKPWIHYIPVRADLSDLMEKIYWAETHFEEAWAIAENTYQFAIENFAEDKVLARVRSVAEVVCTDERAARAH